MTLQIRTLIGKALIGRTLIRTARVATACVCVAIADLPSTAAAQGTRPVGDLLIEPSDSEVVDVPSTVVGSARVTLLTVINPSATEKTSMVGSLLNPQYSFYGGRYPGTGATCSRRLAPQSTCTIAIEYTPKALGPARAVVRINYWTAARPETSFRVLVSAPSENLSSITN